MTTAAAAMLPLPLPLLLLLLAASVRAVHDNSFCSLTPDRGVSLPQPPSAFRLYMRSTSSLSGKVTQSMEYFDQEAKRSAFLVSGEDGSFRIVVYHDREQAAVINRTSNAIPGACSVQSAKEDDLKLGITLAGQSSTVPSVYFFFGKGGENIEDQGTEQINSISAKKFYSCFYVASQDASVQATWYYAADGSAYRPLRILVKTKLNAIGITTDVTHEISNFYTQPPHWTSYSDPFIPPPGVYCPGLGSASDPKPRLPKSFGMRLEDSSKLGYQTFFKEAYDFGANLTLLEGVPPLTSGDALKYGIGKLQYVHDFSRGLAYISNLDLGNCTFKKIELGEWDSQTDSRQVRMKSPTELFDLDTPDTQYKGTGTTRGYKSDVFISFKRLMRDNALYNTTIEWHFTNRSIFNPVTQAMDTVSVPVRCLVTSDYYLMGSTMEIYDFDTSKIRFNTHDITKCFNRDHKKYFQIFYPMTSNSMADSVRQKPEELISTTIPLLVDGLGIGPLRILDPEVSVEGDTAVLELTVTDKPDFLSDAVDAPLSIVESRLQELVSGKMLMAIFTDKDNNLLSTTANMARAVDSRGPAPSGGYGAGSMIGLALGMAVLGLAIGVGIIFGVYKTRGGTLSGLDPFQPQRLV